jgi:Zn finger protein HypA/HybF involved in hydrogenase expression
MSNDVNTYDLRTDIQERKEDILRWIEEERSKAYMCSQLHCKQATLNAHLLKMDIVYDGQQNQKGRPNAGKKTAEEYASGDNVKSHILKAKLIQDGIKKCECEICGAYIWQGEPLPLELHHKDGNHYNNDLENLQILCPNCHSIQDGNSGSNIGKYTKQKNIVQDDNANKRAQKCLSCGKTLSPKAKTGYCSKCIHEQQRKVKRPAREELKSLIRNTSFLAIGRQYGVSDKAVEKWCVAVGLPYKTREIKSMTDEEWAMV